MDELDRFLARGKALAEQAERIAALEAKLADLERKNERLQELLAGDPLVREIAAAIIRHATAKVVAKLIREEGLAGNNLCRRPEGHKP